MGEEMAPLVITFQGSELDFLKFQIRYSVPLSLSEGEITLLAYLFLHREKAKEKFLSSGHSKSAYSVDNYLSKFRKLGLLTGTTLNPKLYLTTSADSHIYAFKVI